MRRRIPWSGLLLILAMLVTGIGWSLASPLASSPDDDYHLGSIWCPRPAGETCATTVIDGVVEVEVPMAVSEDAMKCFVFASEKSAGCAVGYADDATTWSARYDDGNYPRGYYRFHHAFVTADPQFSVGLMRVVNVLIAVGLMSVLGMASPPQVRRAMTLAIMASWVPMGVYFIASNNPSSWAITGVLGFAVGAYAATQSDGWRRWVLMLCSVVGAALCLASRYDASFYLFVVAVALAFAVRWQRGRLPEAVMVAGLAVLGAYWMLDAGQAQTEPTTDSTAASPGSFMEKLWAGIMWAPKYFGGFYGLVWQPGWGDVPLYVRAPFVLVIVAAGAYALVGLSRVSWRKALALLTVGGAMTGLPAVFFATGIFDDILAYQARYILPLLAVLFFLMLAVDGDDAPLFTRPQTVLLIGCVVLAHAVALHTVILRFVRGASSEPLPFHLDADIQWWWQVPVSPMTTWVVASLAFVIAATIPLWSATTSPGARSASPVLRSVTGEPAAGVPAAGEDEIDDSSGTSHEERA